VAFTVQKFASGLWPRNFAEGNDVLSLK